MCLERHSRQVGENQSPRLPLALIESTLHMAKIESTLHIGDACLPKRLTTQKFSAYPSQLTSCIQQELNPSQASKAFYNLTEPTQKSSCIQLPIAECTFFHLDKNNFRHLEHSRHVRCTPERALLTDA